MSRLALLALVALLLGGCAPPTDYHPPEPQRYYQSRSEGFWIRVPGPADGLWEVRENLPPTAVAIFAPLKTVTARFRANLVVLGEDLPRPQTAQEMRAQELEGMSQSPGFVLVGQGEEAGRPWAEFRHQLTGSPLQVLAFFIVKPGGGRGYIVSGTAAPEDFAAYRPLFVEAGTHFGFGPPPPQPGASPSPAPGAPGGASPPGPVPPPGASPSPAPGAPGGASPPGPEPPPGASPSPVPGAPGGASPPGPEPPPGASPSPAPGAPGGASPPGPEPPPGASPSPAPGAPGGTSPPGPEPPPGASPSPSPQAASGGLAGAPALRPAPPVGVLFRRP
ncbi:MAG TPA: hypothetical protein VNO81_08780 [Candidatus Nitrosotenuis sp.]|nr:hypothetical protein [Candidatus Nitrosotenuis sp.]